MVSISYFRNLWLKVGDKRIGHRTISPPLAVILMTAPLPPVLNRPWLIGRLHYAPPIGRHREQRAHEQLQRYGRLFPQPLNNIASR